MNSARARKALDRLAYASLVLDICIAVITAVGVFDARGSPKSLLFPIDYLLTIVVVLSMIMFIVLLSLRTKERQVEKALDKSQSPT